MSTETIEMTAQAVGEGLVAFCKEGKFGEAVTAYYSDDIVSTEAQGEDREVEGIEAVNGKMQWWMNTMTVNTAEVNGPWVNEPFFVVQFNLNVTNKESNETTDMNEFGVYEVEDGKIISERFFS